ncbi:MAG: hypothetical protein AB7S65_09765 [Sulfuricurvum sp.]
MIKLLCLILLISSLAGKEETFLFPDQKSEWENHILLHLRKNPEQIVVVTDTFDIPKLKKPLLKTLQRGSSFDLILQNPNGVSSWAQYANVTLRVYPSRPLRSSVLILKDHTACLIGGSLSETVLKDSSVMALCSDDPAFIHSLYDTILPLYKRSSPYLE